MGELLTTKEMALLLGVNEKTFRKAVKEQNLLFHRIGNSRRFNPAKILEVTEAVEASANIPEKKTGKKRYSEPSANKKRFENMLGLVG